MADGLRRDVKAAADALKGEIREAIVAAFVAAEGDRSALPEGTGIRVSKGKPTLVYLDEMAALE
ncbi:MAG: hypothetical protein GWN58_42385, partial [Anaerolineae bacterium]|nr:hypothetical protein [Anaerolineae bacterium]